MRKLISLTVILLTSSNILASQEDLYDFLWLDPDKSVYVLQKKMYEKKRTFYLNAGYLKNMSSDFQSTAGFNLEFGYFFKEDWGLELMYNSYSNSNNDSFENIKKINGQEPFVRKPISNMALMFTWSPFYGKVNTFNKIYYFDWSFGVGVAKLETESNANTVANSATQEQYESESYTGAVLKTNLKFYVTQRMHVEIDFMSTIYNAPGPKINDQQTEGMTTNSDLVFSVGFSF